MDNIEVKTKELIRQIKDGMKGISKKAVCKKAGVSYSYLYALLNNPDYDHNIILIGKIADVVVVLKTEKLKKEKDILERSASKLQTINQ